MEKVGSLCVAAMAAIVFLVLLADSGALTWAILGGLLSGGCAFLVLRDWQASATAGTAIALVISVIGVGRMFA